MEAIDNRIMVKRIMNRVGTTYALSMGRVSLCLPRYVGSRSFWSKVTRQCFAYFLDFLKLILKIQPIGFPATSFVRGATGGTIIRIDGPKLGKLAECPNQVIMSLTYMEHRVA